MATSSVSMKLLIDSQAKRVLFAEASKECVDLLFYMLSLPVATVVSLLSKQGMVGSLSNLYQSVENLNESYLQKNQSKDNLLKPKTLVQGSTSVPLLLHNDASSENNFNGCSNRSSTRCQNCGATVHMHYVGEKTTSSSDEGGFVKGLVTYMVMDNLEVKPMSTISSITLLNKFNVKEVGKLEEKVVSLGMDEAVKLLKASLQSDKVLTDVFLKG